MAEAVDKVPKLKIFEIMIQNSGLRRGNIAANAAHTNNSCEKFDGPDFDTTSERFLRLERMIEVFKQVVPEAKLRVDETTPSSQTSAVWLDTSRAQEELGYVPKYDLPSAVADYVEWYRNLKP